MTNLLDFLSIPLHWWKSRHNLSWVLRKKNYTVSPPNWFTMKESMTLRKRLSRTHRKSSRKRKQLKLLEKTKYFKVWAQICVVSQRFIHWCLISNNALSREKTWNYCMCVFQIYKQLRILEWSFPFRLPQEEKWGLLMKHVARCKNERAKLASWHHNTCFVTFVSG